ncbi:MAG: hypothetical protein ABI600_14225 [Luteolibacter sp.]
MITSPALEVNEPLARLPVPASTAAPIPITIPIPVAAAPSVEAVRVPPLETPREVIPAPQPAAPVEAAAAVVEPAPEKPKEEPARATGIPAKRPSITSKELKTKAAPDTNKSPRRGLIPVMLVSLLLFLGALAAVLFVAKDLAKNIDPPTASVTPADSSVSEANYLRIGWQKEAYQVLRSYMDAKTSKEKLPFVLNANGLSSKIEDFYGGGAIIDSDTPPDAFSIYELSEEDRKRGLFMMIYDQPPQFDMKEFFRPLASLEVQYGVEEADLLLSTVARVGNFAMEPLRVHAFFKRTPEGLKLDWEIFAQTKYRTFQTFVELPEIGQKGTFRLFVVEDVPDKGRAIAGTRTYRLADPANTSDVARVNVKVDSDVGRALSMINWRGTRENHPITRTVTVELKWAGEDAAPELEISRFICWEFLGLGGQETPATASTK